MTIDDRPPVDADTRRAALLHDLRNRLGPTCRDWPADLFTAMVERLADITLRYDGRASTSTYDRRTTDRLVAELKAALGKNENAREPNDG